MARKQRNTVNYSWWVSTMKARVRRELNTHPDICRRLGNFQQRFIIWCAKQRLIYEDDIDDECQEFSSKFIRSRLETIDIDLYYQKRKEVMERDNYTCKYCGTVGGRLEIDHILPISKGGLSTMDNLTTACYQCNRSKRDKTPNQFMVWRLQHG